MIKNQKPPNYDLLKNLFPINKTSLFAYAPHIYAPYTSDIPEDREIHENVHIERQTNPADWWHKYIQDPEFRKTEETLAYAVQYLAVKKTYPAKNAKLALDEFAVSLSTCYNLQIEQHQAETLIRKEAEKLNRNIKNKKELIS